MELPDDLLKRAKSTAARRGQSMTSFFRAAVEAKLMIEEKSEREKPWMSFSGVFSDPEESARILDRIEQSCGQIDPEEWT
jgi:hypothetical protein